MCTVTFLPKEGSDFILTSNRDEVVDRAAKSPQRYQMYGQTIVFPKDPLGNGTWVATTGDFTLCLLNGAFVKHSHQPPYRRSRGLVLLDFYQFLNVETFAKLYDFTDIEPFTLLILEARSNVRLNELRWDGNRITTTSKPADQPQIWSSATLYTSEVIRMRESWFESWLLDNQAPTVSSILDFHHFKGSGTEQNDIVMKRNDRLRTISVTCIHSEQGALNISYEDLVTNTHQQCKIF